MRTLQFPSTGDGKINEENLSLNKSLNLEFKLLIAIVMLSSFKVICDSVRNTDFGETTITMLIWNLKVVEFNAEYEKPVLDSGKERD
ncbi:hypothetical protein C5167_006582 [Papaver somniferum]|uniref:Uncharacterized protein n=1 Tax=Papaver somniferum TaxID=3469 RepID=A0A4Y7JGW9_PAPSO|nr:hypothetical protein C5167_006582 [Papaver somniferum]